MPKAFHLAMTPQDSTRRKRPPSSDRRQKCLDEMFQVALSCASENLVFGRDWVLQKDEARPSLFSSSSFRIWMMIGSGPSALP